LLPLVEMPGVEPGSVSTSAKDSFTGLVSVYQNSVQTVSLSFSGVGVSH